MYHKFQTKFEEHVIKALELFDVDNLIGVFLEGSQNYGIATVNSDIDSKVILTPSFNSIAYNEQAQSSTFIFPNEEHLNYKDFRLFFNCLRKQNINFVEILFTDHFYINPLYLEPWNALLDIREQVARYNPYRAIVAMCGMADRNYKLIFNKTDTNAKYFEKYGYYPKALAHIIRINDFLVKYVTETSYKKCLQVSEPALNDVMICKLAPYDIQTAIDLADLYYDNIQTMRDIYLKKYEDKYNPFTEDHLKEIQRWIMEISIKNEFDNERMEKVLNER